jgi:(p)ppGpp synthase/HD superfamily hydrolase
VQWAPTQGSNGGPSSQVDVDMSFEDNSGMLASISQAISAEGSDILNCHLRTEPNETGFAAMTIVVRDAAQLARILSRLQGLKGMVRVERRGQARSGR